MPEKVVDWLRRQFAGCFWGRKREKQLETSRICQIQMIRMFRPISYRKSVSKLTGLTRMSKGNYQRGEIMRELRWAHTG